LGFAHSNSTWKDEFAQCKISVLFFAIEQKQKTATSKVETYRANVRLNALNTREPYAVIAIFFYLQAPHFQARDEVL
jgi:hypothetical protein